MKLRYLLWYACLERMFFDFDFDLGYLNVQLKYQDEIFVEWLQMLILNQHQWSNNVFLGVYWWGLLKAYL